MFMTTPLRTAIDYVIQTTRAMVGAGKVLRVLAIQPTVRDPDDPVTWPARISRLEDRRSGLVLERGQLCAMVTDLPEEAAAQADRLGRFSADDADVFVNGVAIGNYALDDVRSHIIVSEIEPRLFSGELRYELMPHGLVDDERIYEVLRATSSLDVLDALEEGLATTVEERDRGFSGGQRQRLWPRTSPSHTHERRVTGRSWSSTSAVDTHTEGRIAARLREIREGKTTLLATTSPLLLEKMDYVYLVDNGHVSDQGTHNELVARSPRYRQIVLREDS